MKDAPLVGTDLVDYLRKQFGTRDLLKPTADLADMHRIQGEQKVIDHLEGVVKFQARRAAETTVKM